MSEQINGHNIRCLDCKEIFVAYAKVKCCPYCSGINLKGVKDV